MRRDAVRIFKVTVAVLAAAAYLYVAKSHFMPVFEERVGFTFGRRIVTGFAAISILWFAGWYLILFSNPEAGTVIRHSNRPLHISLGIGMTFFAAMLVYTLTESQKSE